MTISESKKMSVDATAAAREISKKCPFLYIKILLLGAFEYFNKYSRAPLVLCDLE